jgi:hypothetical protein
MSKTKPPTRLYGKIRVVEDGPITRITLFNPERRNAIGPQMVNELLYALDDAHADEDGKRGGHRLALARFRHTNRIDARRCVTFSSLLPVRCWGRPAALRGGPRRSSPRRRAPPPHCR